MYQLPLTLACATCMPDPNSAVAVAGSNALVFMLAVLFAVLGIFLKVIFNFARKQRESLKSNS